ncbi:MAG: DUF4910 domain-containing protein [Desulfobacterales bacterium]|jgi:aminopeptidase-like protein
MDKHLPQKIEHYFDKLWPINRSITGPGIRESLDILSEIIPLKRLKFNSGEKVFDWIVPREWKANEAYFVDPTGRKHAHFSKNNLHLVGYSRPIRKKMNLAELKEKLHTLPDQPDAIPYVVRYYDSDWGFCLTHHEYERLPEGLYEVFIDTELYNGHLEIGEAVLEGETTNEILFSTYLCHPSMANNELSGPLALAFLYNYIKDLPNRLNTYRFVISAETIGTICYLDKRGDHLKNHLKAGYVMTCLGNSGSFTYKQSRRGNSLADKAAKTVLKEVANYKVISFSPFGSDERQYCSPGFNLPVGSLMRTMYAKYPEYHTSLDNKDFISFEALAESIEVYLNIVKAIESNKIWVNKIPFGEPQLGKRNLYPSSDPKINPIEDFQAIKWLLNLADGESDLLDIADSSGIKISTLAEKARLLFKAGLIAELEN